MKRSNRISKPWLALGTVVLALGFLVAGAHGHGSYDSLAHDGELHCAICALSHGLGLPATASVGVEPPSIVEAVDVDPTAYTYQVGRRLHGSRAPPVSR